MITSLKQLINNMHHTFTKDDVIKTTEQIFANLNNEVIPTLETLINSDVKKLQESGLLKLVITQSGIRAKDNRDGLVKIKGAFVVVNKEYNNVIKLLNNELNDNITDKSITAKEAAILKMINDIGALSAYMFDLMYLVLLGTDETSYPKIKLTKIKENLGTFTEAFKVYNNNYPKLIKTLGKVSNETININDGKDSHYDLLLSKTGKLVNLPIAKGFVGNPIYHVRMWLLDRDIKKYESQKDKKRLIELKLTELKLEESHQSNEKLKKQIAYYEDKLSDIEYDIEQFEND